MIKPTYLFYDIETSGLNKSFDQILQFAAIRTDLSLQEIERHEIKVKLNPDVIIAPRALITHRISIEESLKGISEIDAIQTIHTLMNTPGTISVGYNTLGFDDEFLRFSFYRSLLPPYTHQFANQCSRMDLYPMTQMYFLYDNQRISWPQIEDKSSLKLEHLSAANQLATGAAHTAITDVEATVALARLLIQNREMWDYLIAYFDKQIDLQRLNQLPTFSLNSNESHRLGLMIDGQCGSNAFYQCPALSLGTHRHYKNQTLWLRLDKPELAATAPETIAENTWVFRKKGGEPGLLLPMNARFMRHLTPERLKIMEDNKKWLQENPNILAQVIHYHQEYTYPKVPRLDIDSALYENGFLTPHEQQQCHLFLQTKPEKKATIIDRFTHAGMRELAIRIMGRHYLNDMPTALAEEFSHYMQSINPTCDTQALVDYRGQKRLTPRAALNEIAILTANENLDQQQYDLLQGLKKYIQHKFPILEPVS